MLVYEGNDNMPEIRYSGNVTRGYQRQWFVHDISCDIPRLSNRIPLVPQYVLDWKVNLACRLQVEDLTNGRRREVLQRHHHCAYQLCCAAATPSSALVTCHTCHRL